MYCIDSIFHKPAACSLAVPLKLISCLSVHIALQVKALNGLIREVNGIRPHAFWNPLETNGEGQKGKKAGVALKRPNQKKYRKGLPWQRHNGFGHRIRRMVVKYAHSLILSLLLAPLFWPHASVITCIHILT